jgi:hypothetical protein
MSVEFKNYDPKKVIVTFRGVLLRGFMDGTFVSAERTEDAYEMAVGAAGDVTRVRNRNRTGAITVTLMAESPSNDELSAVVTADELTGLGYGPFLVKDLNGTTLLVAAQSWVRKLPVVEYADTGSGREWVFDCAELVEHVGGALSIGV